MVLKRLLILAGGLAGAAGVALSAASAHGGGGAFAGTISSMLLFHAPAFLTLGLARDSQRLRIIGSLVLLAGLALFCLDLAARDLGWTRLFPMAAPLGGSAMILGWLCIAVSALTPASTRETD